MKNYKFIVINLEAGMPTVAQANKMLELELNAARKLGITAVKIIHGYGSTGAGGKIRNSVRSTLKIRKGTGKIKDFVPGENWDIFNQTTREIIQACTELSKDSDLNRFNSGITIVLLK